MATHQVDREGDRDCSLLDMEQEWLNNEVTLSDMKLDNFDKACMQLDEKASQRRSQQTTEENYELDTIFLVVVDVLVDDMVVTVDGSVLYRSLVNDQEEEKEGVQKLQNSQDLAIVILEDHPQDSRTRGHPKGLGGELKSSMPRGGAVHECLGRQRRHQGSVEGRRWVRGQREDNFYMVKIRQKSGRKGGQENEGKVSGSPCCKNKREKRGKRKVIGPQENQASCSNLDPNEGYL